MMRFVIRSRRWPLRRWWFAIVDTGNNATLCHSEQYQTKRACREAIDQIKAGAWDAQVFDRSR